MERLIKVNNLSLKMPDFNPMEYNKNLMDDMVRKVSRESEQSVQIMEKEIERREQREEENRENLRKAAENTDITNEKLEKQIQQKNEDLQNQREQIHMLKQQLNGINRTLSDLFIIEEGNQELNEEANKLARQIYATLIQNKKVDFKSILTEKGPDVLLAAIPIILQIAKVI